MIRVRLADLPDVDEVVAMMRHNAESTRPDLNFSELRTRATFASYMERASPTVWVAEDDHGIVGCFVGDYFPYPGADGLFTQQQVLYVKPEKRGTRAAVMMMRAFIEWSVAIGAHDIVGGNDNEFQSERTAKFLGHFGFRPVGFMMRKDLANG